MGFVLQFQQIVSKGENRRTPTTNTGAKRAVVPQEIQRALERFALRVNFNLLPPKFLDRVDGFAECQQIFFGDCRQEFEKYEVGELFSRGLGLRT